MYKFEDLMIGDMFNVVSGRWVKISQDMAICVMSCLYYPGKLAESDFFKNCNIILLYSSILVTPTN